LTPNTTVAALTGIPLAPTMSLAVWTACVELLVP